MEIVKRIIPAKPRSKELYFEKGGSSAIISGGGGSSGGGSGSSYWTLIDTDENDEPLDNPYIKTTYPVVGEKNITAYGVNNTESNGNDGISSIADANDVILTNLTTDDLLKYNGTHWVNIAMSSLITGGGGASTIDDIVGLQTALDSKLNKTVFEDMFEKVEISSGEYAIKAKYNFFGIGAVSAYGLDLSGGGGSGGDYILPTASATTLGGIKVGSGLSISSGILSANSQTDNNFTNTLLTKLNGIATGATANTGTVTSVGLSVPTGLSVTGSPITSSGTFAISLASGYSIPTTTKQGQWDTAYSQRHTHNNKTIIDALTQGHINVLNKLSLDAQGNVKVDATLWATGGVSAYGLGEGGGSSGGGGGSIVTWGTESGGYVPLAVEGISKSVALSTHTHSQYALSNHTHSQYASTTHNHSGVYEPTFTKNTAFNKDFGTTSTTVARGNHTHSGVYEPVLGNPTVNGYLLSSTTTGTRSWVKPYALPTASASTLGGVKIGTNVSISNGTISVHNPLTIGTANGLSLSNQQLSLSLANTTNNGALSANDKKYIDLLRTLFEHDTTNNAIKALKPFYSVGEVSAYGLGGTDNSKLSSWTGYTSAMANYYVPASLLVPFRNDTLSRLESLEAGSGDVGISITGSGNAITSLTKSGNVITANKGSTFALSNHTHNYLSLTGGTMTGILKAQNNTSYTTKQVRNMILSTGNADSSQMANGDIWIKYE